MVENKRKRYGEFVYDVEAELELYKILAEKIKPFVIDTIQFVNSQLLKGKIMLVEGK